MRARIYIWLLGPSVLVLVSLLLSGIAVAGPCPSGSGGGC